MRVGRRNRGCRTRWKDSYRLTLRGDGAIDIAVPVGGSSAASSVPGAQDVAPNNSLAYPLLAVSKRPRHPCRRGLLRPPNINASRQRLHPPFLDRFSRRADMYATTEAQLTASSTADILVDGYIPL